MDKVVGEENVASEADSLDLEATSDDLGRSPLKLVGLAAGGRQHFFSKEV